MGRNEQAQDHSQRENQGPNSQRIFIIRSGFLRWEPFVSKDEAMLIAYLHQSVVWQWH
jgi:hypothetical protein